MASAESAGREVRDSPAEHQRVAEALGVSVAELAGIEASLDATPPTSRGLGGADGKFSATQLTFGRMADAAKGIDHFLCTTEWKLSMAKLKGLPAIRDEFAALVQTELQRLDVQQATGDAEAVKEAVNRLETARTSFECMESVTRSPWRSSSRHRLPEPLVVAHGEPMPNQIVRPSLTPLRLLRLAGTSWTASVGTRQRASRTRRTHETATSTACCPHVARPPAHRWR